MSAHTATVEVLTAEVRVLMVGSRQITLSVFKQLDEVDEHEIEPMGRVNANKETGVVEVVGRYRVVGLSRSGSLVRSAIDYHNFVKSSDYLNHPWHRLPLIVLAGLK